MALLAGFAVTYRSIGFQPARSRIAIAETDPWLSNSGSPDSPASNSKPPLTAEAGHDSAQFESTHRSIEGEFVVEDVVRNLEEAKKHLPKSSRNFGKYYAVRVKYNGKAPEWFGDKPVWVQSLPIDLPIVIGSRFSGEIHYDAIEGFYVPCLSPIQFFTMSEPILPRK